MFDAHRRSLFFFLVNHPNKTRGKYHSNATCDETLLQFKETKTLGTTKIGYYREKLETVRVIFKIKNTLMTREELWKWPLIMENLFSLLSVFVKNPKTTDSMFKIWFEQTDLRGIQICCMYCVPEEYCSHFGDVGWNSSCCFNITLPGAVCESIEMWGLTPWQPSQHSPPPLQNRSHTTSQTLVDTLAFGPTINDSL